LLGKLVTRIRQIGDLSLRMSAIQSVSPYLTKHLFRNELTEIRAIEETHHRAALLCAVTPYLPPDLQVEVVGDYLACAGHLTRGPVLELLSGIIPTMVNLEKFNGARAIRRAVVDCAKWFS